MSVQFLQELAATPLPKSFIAAKDMDAVKILRQAGLVLAQTEGPPSHGVRVLAITDAGRKELLRFRYPDERLNRSATVEGWWRTTAQRARQVFKSSDQNGRRDRA